ncbi:N-carbamoylputrescine amidase [Reinekea blandensis]|uniref:Probable hydratase n=1 Tax=Reinekea blandensis MED297 TaxID=314283 RepID=A4B9A7_9GAMM|nr:N-carbamoylputrescine amidase [Reinekea blandensis]EAR11208.1 probable hydratase [Reinekea sp. MED297] [Reinekea blandensis MED297]
MREVTVAATQMPCGWDVSENLKTAERLVREAAASGAQVILLQELFERPYFCQHQKEEFRRFATAIDDNPAIAHFAPIARELGVVLPISFFEQCGPVAYNSVVVLDADGENLGLYRKTHIPDGPGYCEKFYFTPGDTGFQVFSTRFGRIGVGICWDQWFPETARAMTLMGAELLFYPTAIGSEPYNPDIDSSGHWQRTQQGHAAANVIPLIASNRIGTEVIDDTQITFYGSSFIADNTGALVTSMDRTSTGFIQATFDLDALNAQRSEWGLFRDRRPSQYGTLMTKDGRA